MDWSAFVGLQWKDRGRTPEGYDCWGLLIAAFEAGTGVALPSHVESYSTAADQRETAAILAGEVGDWTKVDEPKAQPFDAVVMVIARRVHVGLIVRRGLMLHMPVGKTSVIEPLTRFAAVTDGVYRHKRLM